jgi:hypothetical protein
MDQVFSKEYLALVQNVREAENGRDSRQKIVEVLNARNNHESENFNGKWGPYDSPNVLATKNEVITQASSLFKGFKPTGYTALPFNTTISEEVSKNSELATTSGALADYLGDIDTLLVTVLGSDKAAKFKKKAYDSDVLPTATSNFVSL